MGYNSQAGQVGFGLQVSKGTAVAATRFARIRGGSLGGDRELLIPDAEIGGNRDIQQAYLGPIAFSGSLDFYPRMQMLAMLLKGAFGSSSSSDTAGVSEVQTITISGTPTGGTFTLTFRGQTTAAIDFDATAAEVETAFEALSTVGAGNGTCAGGPLPGTPVTVTFSGDLAASNPPIITAVSSLTGGTNPAIAIAATTPGYPAMGVHTITPADTVPWLTIEERIGTSLESFQYTDTKIGKLRIEADATGYLMGSVDVLALGQVADFTAQTDPDWDLSPMMVGSSINLYHNAVRIPVKSFFFEIDNALENDDFRLGSVFLEDAVEKRRLVKIGFGTRPETSELWKTATYGDSDGTEAVAGAAISGAWQIVMTSFEDIQGTSTPYRLIIDIPSGVIVPFKFSPSGDDVLENDVEVQLTRPDPLVPICTATVRNDLATIV
ncbi:MAG: phage tail tube protein [Porticoccaceae bacterium]